jgi:hypothetical protein
MIDGSVIQRRRLSRCRVMLSASFQLAEQPQPVILRNISAAGALVASKQLPAEGATVVFVRSGLRVPTRIVWVEGHCAGVAFAHLLDRAELLRQVPKPRERFEPQFRREGLACRPLTDADRKMVEMWSTPRRLRRDSDAFPTQLRN